MNKIHFCGNKKSKKGNILLESWWCDAICTFYK